MPRDLEETLDLIKRLNEIADDLRFKKMTLEEAEKEIDEIITKLNS